MIQKFLSKYITEVIPSIIATVIGAYIVTHYINAKPDDKPATAVSTPAVPAKAVADTPKTGAPKIEAVKLETTKPETAKPETVKAEPVNVAPQPTKSETAVETETGSEKSAQAARVLRQHQIVVKERATKSIVVEKAAVPEKAVPVEANATPEDRRDANDIARAAIERLRGSEPRAAETKTPERKLNTVGYAPAVAPAQTYVPQTYAAPPVQAAPPPAAYVPPPAREAAIPATPPALAPLPSENVAPLTMPPPPASVARIDDPSRPTPPADIPPLDIRGRDNSKQNTSVAEDVVSAAKNAFQSVMPR